MNRFENVTIQNKEPKKHKCVHWMSASSLDLSLDSCSSFESSSASCDDCKYAGDSNYQRPPPKCTCKRIRIRRRQADRSRITRLAVPKHFTPRHRYRMPCSRRRLNAPIDKHHIEKPIPTRLQQLALPTVRCLRSARSTLRGTLAENRFAVLNKHLQASLFTTYTRLANVPMPQKRVKPKIDWTAHGAWLKTRATPKTQYVASIPMQIPPSFDGFPAKINLLNLERLAQPKSLVLGHLAAKSPTAISPHALSYTMTPAIAKLTTPRSKPVQQPIAEYERAEPVPHRYSAIASMGMAKLAEPRRVNKRWTRGDAASVVFVVPRNALKYKASKRIGDLAKPRAIEVESHVREDPYRVSPKALKKLKAKKEAIFKRLTTRHGITASNPETTIKVDKARDKRDKTTKKGSRTQKKGVEGEMKEKVAKPKKDRKDKTVKPKVAKEKALKPKKAKGLSKKSPK